jgi:hypothetical protein
MLLAVLLAVLASGNPPESTLLWNALFDAGHVPLFGLAALAIRGLLRVRPSVTVGLRFPWLAFALTVALGALTESLQVLQWDREPSIADLLRDVAGAGAFLLLSAARREGESGAGPASTRGRVGRRLAVLLAVALLAGSLAHLAMTAAAYVERGRAQPTLVALDGSWWERWFIEERDSALTPRTRPPGFGDSLDEPLARLDLRAGRYPGIALVEPYPDWSAHRRLVFTVVSDLDDALTLVVRVHDAAHDQRHEDRFNRSLTVSPGVNRFAIPLDDIRRAPDRREMDLHRIRGIILFAYQLQEPTRVYLGAFRLE